MGDDGQQKRNHRKKRTRDTFWAILDDDDQGRWGDFAEYDGSNFGEILNSINPDSSSSCKHGFLSSVSTELELQSWYAKRHRGNGVIPVSAPKPFDPKQKGVAINPELKHCERRRVESPTDQGECSVPLCAVCDNDQQLIRLSPCQHCVCHRCLGEKIVKEHAEKVKCPHWNCLNELTPEQFRCHEYVPREVSYRWLKAASEARALVNPGYFICPLCEAVLFDDEMGFLIRVCTACWGMFCMTCRVPWHMGLQCNEYMALAYGYDNDDAVVLDLVNIIDF